jgi:sensor histidine kinase regulating citrate/malate metabolism
MSSEPDYNFNQPASTSIETASLMLPFALLTAAIAIILVAQTVNVFKQRSSLRDGTVELTKAYHDREPLVKQSHDLQEKLQTLVLDLLLLAKTDDEAKQIVTKYNIQQQGTPSAPESAPAPAEAPKP